MTRGAAAIPAFLVLLGVVSPALAQPPGATEPLRSGRAALDVHDPAQAIRHFERVDTPEGRRWLATALMMESRSSSDAYVERAFEAAMRARPGQASPRASRAELAAALRPAEMVIAFLVGETSAWAWALDRDTLVGYPLPAPSEIATAATRLRAYLDSGDRDGVQRIAEDLMPSLLGPAQERLSKLTRLIVVVDGPLKGLPIGVLPASDDHAQLQQQVAVTVVEDGLLIDAIRSAPLPPAARDSSWHPGPLVMGVAVVMLLLAGLAVFLRR